MKKRDLKRVTDAYNLLVDNCRNHHDTCKGCPLYVEDKSSEIPRCHCAAFIGGNMPPAAWPSASKGAPLDIPKEELEETLTAQKIAIITADTVKQYPESAKLITALIDSFKKD